MKKRFVLLGCAFIGFCFVSCNLEDLFDGFGDEDYSNEVYDGDHSADVYDESAPVTYSPCDLSVEVASFSQFDPNTDMDDGDFCEFSSWSDAGKTGSNSKEIYVSPLCIGDQTGELVAPYCTIEDAITYISSTGNKDSNGWSILIEPGEYSLNQTIDDSVPTFSLKGLCTTTTIITPLLIQNPIFTISSSQATISISGVTFHAQEFPSIEMDEGNLTLSNVSFIHDVTNQMKCMMGIIQQMFMMNRRQ